MELKRLKEDKYLWILIALSFIFIVYWALFSNYRYVTYTSQYYDVGVEAYSLYWHIHGLQFYPNVLDYIVFTNHLSIFSILLLPFFALYPHPTTFFLIEYIFLAMSAILVYFIADGLIKSRKIGFAMALAFLINPATTGLTLFDFHLESLAVFFYILTFYFYMKEKKLYFVISFILLLSLYDVEPIVGATLLVALLFYELFYNRKSKGVERAAFKKRLTFIGIGLLLAVIFTAFYSVAATYIIKSYDYTSASAMVPIQRIKNYLSEQVSVLAGATVVKYSTSTIINGSILGLVVFFFGFGITSIFNPILSLLLYSPWLLEVLVVHNTVFLNPYNQYYSFALGGSVVSTVLGFLIIIKKKKKIFNLEIYNIKKYENIFAFGIIFLAVILFIMLSSIILNLYTLNYAPTLNYTQINQALTLIPPNATVMAQPNIAAHLYYVHNLELPPVDEPSWFVPVGVSVYWTQPQYIITDKSLQLYQGLVNSSTFNINNYTARNYSLIYNKSGINIFKRAN